MGPEMKKIFLVAAVMAALVSGHALAADTITINGEIIEKGCTIGNNSNADINLATVTVPQVKEVGVGAEFANQPDTFLIKDCPSGYDIQMTFNADVPAGFPDGIVNTEMPSSTVVAHYLKDARLGMSNEYLTKSGNNTVYITDADATAAQTTQGYNFPVESGYLKIADVDDQNSPAGITKSVVTLNVYYRQ